jgi:hypothetical protein
MVQAIQSLAIRCAADATPHDESLMTRFEALLKSFK